MLYYYIHFSVVNSDNLAGLILEILISLRRVVAQMYLCSISSFPIRFTSVKLAFENWRDLLKNPRLSLPRGRTAIQFGHGLKIETLKTSVSDWVSILRLWKLRLGKIESQTRSHNWDSEIYSFGLGLKIETQKIWVLDSVSKLRLRNSSLGPGLKIETLKIPVLDSVSKCKSWSGQSL